MGRGLSQCHTLIALYTPLANFSLHIQFFFAKSWERFLFFSFLPQVWNLNHFSKLALPFKFQLPQRERLLPHHTFSVAFSFCSLIVEREKIKIKIKINSERKGVEFVTVK